MNLITDIFSSYSQFFSLTAILNVLSDPASWGMIGTLILLEGLLSADNALVLAVMVKHLPKEEQKKALFYGIMGAYLFRFLVIGIGVYLVKIWWIKLIGALYLVFLAADHFLGKSNEENISAKKYGFWGTVLMVEIMDIAFSIDSVLAAFGVSEQIWVLFLGGIFGILMMRGIAQVFIQLINKYPELENTAYILILLIGLKMAAATFGFHLQEIYFFLIMGCVFLGTFVFHYAKEKTIAIRNNVN